MKDTTYPELRSVYCGILEKTDHDLSGPHCTMSVSYAIIGLDNGLTPIRHHAVIWTNTDSLLNGPLRTYISAICIII